jgi:hypothetical protein
MSGYIGSSQPVAVGAGSVETADLIDDVVTAAKIAAGAVGASELAVSGEGTSGQYLGSDADGTFSWTSISADPSMGGDLSGVASNAQLVANSVTGTEIASDAITSVKILDGAVTSSKIASSEDWGLITGSTDSADLDFGSIT